MIAFFSHAFLLFILVVIIGVIGLLLSAAIVLPGAYLVKRFTRIPEKRRQDTAAAICLVLTVSFTLLQLVMHIRMTNKLEPLAKEFTQDAHMENGEVVVSDEIVAERNRMLREHGYVHLGRWWAAYGYERPDVTTDGILYLWVPFL